MKDKKDIRNKTIKFDMDKAEDRELWEWLSNLPHGSFSEEVKRHFRSKMQHFNDPSVGGWSLPYGKDVYMKALSRDKPDKIREE